MGAGGGRGTRSVASFDEDTTTMAVEAARLAVRSVADETSVVPTGLKALYFSTAEPAYVDRTNATAIHAALRLERTCAAVDMVGSQRSAVGALAAALDGSGQTLVVASDIRGGLPTGADESAGGDGAAALLIGDATNGAVLAEYLGGATITDEFVTTWRTPGTQQVKHWDDRFAENVYKPLAAEAWKLALADTNLEAGDVDVAVVTGIEARAVKVVAGKLGAKSVAADLTDTVGNTGAAHPALVLTSALEAAEPGQTIALVVLADGVSIHLFRTTDALAGYTPSRRVVDQIANGGSVTYAGFLQWRGVLSPEPPRRPAPDRTASSAAHRNTDWKFGFVGSEENQGGMVHMPPSRMPVGEGEVDDMSPRPMADAIGTITTFTIDKLVYSLNPPVVFAIVDFDGGGRMPVELTDCDPDDVAIGNRVEMTFRRISSADGIHNYFWKGRLSNG